MSQLDFSSVKQSQQPFHYDISKVNQYYSGSHPERLQRMEEQYAKIRKERARKQQLAMQERISDPNFIRNWGTKNKPDHPLPTDATLAGYTKFLQTQPISKKTGPRGEFPLSYAQRKAKREASKTGFLNSLRSVYPEGSTEKDLMIYYKQGKDQYNKMLGKEKRQLTAQEKQERINRSMIHSSRPAAVIKYADLVQQYDGEDYPDSQRITGFKPGDYPQHDPAIRDRATKVFAELTGTLGIMPVYDPKLASYESARHIYPEDDYDIKFYDMDEDDLTPATLIIKKKFDIDRQGNYVKLPPEQWKIVAVNGYRLPDPSEASQIRRLKDIDYYSTYPTVEARRATPYTKYVKQTFKKNNAKILTVLKDIIRIYLVSEHPDPKYVRLYIGENPVEGVYFSVSPVVLNTIIARAARIWAMGIYTQADLEEFNTDLTREAAIFRQYVSYLSQLKAEGKFLPMIQKGLLEPSLENYLLHHKHIESLLIDEANAIIDGRDVVQKEKGKIITACISAAILAFVNYNIPVLDMFLQQKYNTTFGSISNPNFYFIDAPKPDEIEIATSPMSDKRGKDNGPSPLEKVKGVVYWGAQYLAAGIPSSSSSSVMHDSTYVPPPGTVSTRPKSDYNLRSSSSSSSVMHDSDYVPPEGTVPTRTRADYNLRSSGNLIVGQ